MAPCLGVGSRTSPGNRQLILAMVEAWLGTSSGSDLWGSMGALWGVYMGYIGPLWGVYTRCISIYHDIMISSDESILIALYFANQLTQQHTGNAKLEANWRLRFLGLNPIPIHRFKLRLRPLLGQLSQNHHRFNLKLWESQTFDNRFFIIQLDQSWSWINFKGWIMFSPVFASFFSPFSLLVPEGSHFLSEVLVLNDGRIGRIKGCSRGHAPTSTSMELNCLRRSAHPPRDATSLLGINP